MTTDVIRKWLIRIAEAVEHWPPPDLDDPGVALTTATPAGAMLYSVRTIRDERERAAVQAVLPTITTNDFAAAAQLIRAAAVR